MKVITNLKEMVKLAEQNRLEAINKRFWGKTFYGAQILRPTFFFNDGAKFMIEVGGTHTTPVSKLTKNFVFFIG